MKTWLMKCCNNIVTEPDSNTAVWTQRVMKERFRGGVALVARGCYAESRRFGRSFCSAVQANAESVVLRLTMIETKLMTDGTHTLEDVFFRRYV